MERRRLGASGLEVPVLSLGAMTFGEPAEGAFMHGLGCPEEEAVAMLERALEAGANLVDTADIYGEDGLSERIIGRWLARTGRRDEVILATKFRFTMPYGRGASRRHVVRACEESLRRLRTDRIDLYQVHMQDDGVPEEETLRALDDLVRAGKVLYVGASNYAAHRLVDAAWIARDRRLTPYVSVQLQYSLVERHVELEHVPACRRHGIGILAWSPLGRGFLTGKVRPGQPPPPGTRLDRWNRHLPRLERQGAWRVLDAVEAVAAEVGATAAQVALAWLLRRPGVASVIVGARSVAQLDENLGAAELRLSDAHLARLDRASRFELPHPYDFLQRVQGRW